MDATSHLDRTLQTPSSIATMETNITNSAFGEGTSFSSDHKVIGIQYGLCGLVFLFFGFSLMMLMRWQLAYPGQALPLIGNALNHFFGEGLHAGRKNDVEFYNSLGAMHGTIMIFLGIVPIAFAAFGNFVVPLQSARPT